MNKFFKIALVSAALSIVPALALAQGTCVGDCVRTGLGGIRSIFPMTGIGASQNPIQFIGAIISLMLTIAGAIAVVFVIIGGFMYVTSAGNEEQAEKGRKTLTNAIIGVVIVILAYVIVNVTVNFVSGGVGIFGF